ncbi:MAG: 16S rRNA (cytidine(1402)-2'-O)-methyltransferase [Verrucomicrobia bacterium]|nr:16S rRNA (cytidine(1402)-2'-O)-methyltransferase [Verrucomicrobiota bacterium]NDE62786.1 16S rRNA (cytidine(1402)-2'-O)-methyltransferase [Chlamydiota bacterium]
MLYLVATPIGNLKDISYRAVETLKDVDLILCEDTRHSAPLLRHYEISTPLSSYEQFSEKSKLKRILDLLQAGKKIALISDAGTPAVCDPGALLVKSCHEANIPVTSLPGPAAPITAYSLMGTMKPFQFLGFFPKKEGEQKALFEIMSKYQGVSLFFESPHRIIATVEKIPFEAKITVFRELTKKFEQMITGSKEDILKILNTLERLGEIVVAIEPVALVFQEDEAINFALGLVKNHKIQVNTAAKITAELYPVKKQIIYQKLIDSI